METKQPESHKKLSWAMADNCQNVPLYTTPQPAPSQVLQPPIASQIKPLERINSDDLHKIRAKYALNGPITIASTLLLIRGVQEELAIKNNLTLESA